MGFAGGRRPGSMSEPLARGAVVWVAFSPTAGHQQRGTRPCLVVSIPGYVDSVLYLVIVVPVTSVDRGWPHHVPVRGEQARLPRASFAMTEQPRTISVARVSQIGRAHV